MKERFFIIINSRGKFTGNFGTNKEALAQEFLFHKFVFQDWVEAEEYGYKIIELEIKKGV